MPAIGLVVLVASLTIMVRQRFPSTYAIAAPAPKLDGSYGDYVEYHNYGYVLRHNGEINLAVYNAKLIFHLRLPRWNIQIDNSLYNCRAPPDNARNMTGSQIRNERSNCLRLQGVFQSIGLARGQTHDYVQDQLRHTFQVIKDLPSRRWARSRRGWGTRLLSSITGLASEEQLGAVAEILQNIEAGVQQSLQMWGDGANQLTAAFRVEQSRITNIIRLMSSERQLVRDIQREFLEHRRDDLTYFSKIMSRIVSLTNCEVTYREEADLLYIAAQQLMAGNLPHYLLSHEDVSKVLTQTQNYLQHRQPHMTLSRLDFGYYYSEASFSTFRRGNRVFIAIDAPVIFQSLKMPFHVYEVITFPLSTHHQHEFYSTLATDISTIAVSRDADHFLQITDKNAKPVGTVWDVSHSAVMFVDHSRPTCGNALLHGDLSVIKSHCGYTVRRVPYPRGVVRLYDNTFLFVNITTLRVRCLKSSVKRHHTHGIVGKCNTCC